MHSFAHCGAFVYPPKLFVIRKCANMISGPFPLSTFLQPSTDLYIQWWATTKKYH